MPTRPAAAMRLQKISKSTCVCTCVCTWVRAALKPPGPRTGSHRGLRVWPRRCPQPYSAPHAAPAAAPGGVRTRLPAQLCPARRLPGNGSHARAPGMGCRRVHTDHKRAARKAVCWLGNRGQECRGGPRCPLGVPLGAQPQRAAPEGPMCWTQEVASFHLRPQGLCRRSTRGARRPGGCTGHGRSSMVPGAMPA